VGRDLLFELVEAVVAEDGPRAFALADRAVEAGYDLRLVCRELARVVRDMMVLAVDPARAGEGELGEGELERLRGLGARFSREDLLRAFDLLAAAEQEVRAASQPRYQFEMVLLRWMHVRKLVPLADLIAQLTSGRPLPGSGAGPAPASARHSPGAVPGQQGKAGPPASGSGGAESSGGRDAGRPLLDPARRAAAPQAPLPGASVPAASAVPAGSAAPASGGPLKDALLAEIRTAKGFFYNTVVAQAQRIDVLSDAITFAFLPAHRALREQFEQARPWLQSAAERLAGRRIAVTAVQAAAATAAAAATEEPSSPPAPPEPAAPAKRDLRAEAMASSAVQAMLDVFPADIRDVEEM
jgi:DNA polymerase-3 subunit gamma/tau